ncbi:hypothetical protein SI65_09067 [Aspergillus cristatus]|uniref:Uncharacterized protein n=1 Tax=Aspergillus cristatus TaxID=573508 RepID=A0A1E3B3G0_ASPCR|nr:hypothetical protein SI65_09067 [Aspergillus cristatus]
MKSELRRGFIRLLCRAQDARSEHMSISGKVGLGGQVLGLTVMKAFIQSSSRTGTIYIDGLRFSLDALADTRRARRNHNLSDFEVKYGDYYVASLQLGADAGILASTASTMHAESESLDVKVTLQESTASTPSPRTLQSPLISTVSGYTWPRRSFVSFFREASSARQKRKSKIKQAALKYEEAEAKMGEWEETIKELNPTTDGHNGENTSKYKELQKKLDNLEKTFQSIRNAKLVTEDIPEYKEIQAKLNQWETTIKGLKIERYEAMEKKLNNVEKELAALR